MSEHDPLADNALPAASLATTYQRQSGEMMVYGGTFFGLFALAGGLVSGQPVPLILAALMLGSAFYFFPMIRTERAQLRVEARGLYLDGMGWLPWTSIRDVRMYDKSVRTIRNTQLELQLIGPVKDFVMPDANQGALRAFMTRIWSVKPGADSGNAEMVLVRLEPLRAKPEEILASMQRFLPQAGATG